jgi:hypothetical protein
MSRQTPAQAQQPFVAPWRLPTLVRRARLRLATEPESGSWVTLSVVLMFFFVAMACTGLVVDGSARVRAGQRAGWVAADAARAASNELWAVSATGGGTPDPALAREVAERWVQAANGGTDVGLQAGVPSPGPSSPAGVRPMRVPGVLSYPVAVGTLTGAGRRTASRTPMLAV